MRRLVTLVALGAMSLVGAGLAGSPAYAAPEQRIAGKAVDQPADIYALGLILNEMFTGEIPQGAGFRKIKDAAPDFAYLDELVDLMMQQQPEQRIPESVLREEDPISPPAHHASDPCLRIAAIGIVDSQRDAGAKKLGT